MPTQQQIFRWIEEIVARGVRRPGYQADIWTERFIRDRFRALGLEKARMEPVPTLRWKPRKWSLEVVPHGREAVVLNCFPLPYSAPVDHLELQLARYDVGHPAAVAGKAALYDAAVLRVPPTAFVAAGSAPEDLSGRVFDPDGTFAQDEHVLPHTVLRNRIMDPSIEAGALAFIGGLIDYPADSYRYFVPYDGVARPIPGVWISGSDSTWLHEQLELGPVDVKITSSSTTEEFESHNIVGELAGADDDVVMIGSHHDGPWSSAVEDASGIGLVLAQASFWASQPRKRRPHRMVFVLQAGHMCGGAGLQAYVDAHRAELPSVVLEVHLEHAARDFARENGRLLPTGHCVPRWFFTSRIPRLERAVARAIVAEDLSRSMILAPDALGENPPSDGAAYHRAGVPIMQFLSAPFYLFDAIDRLDKIDRKHLVPLTRAVVRIVESTRGVSAAEMRAAVA